MPKAEQPKHTVKTVAFTGIDPGLTGAIATVSGHLYADGRVILDGQARCDIVPVLKRENHDKRIKYDTEEMIKRADRHIRYDARVGEAQWRCRLLYNVHRVVLEQAQFRPFKNSLAATASAAVGQAAWECALQMCGAEYSLLHPQTWKAKLKLCKKPKSASTDLAIEYHREWLGGGAGLNASIFKHDGIADALCMAMYAFLKSTGSF